MSVAPSCETRGALEGSLALRQVNLELATASELDTEGESAAQQRAEDRDQDQDCRNCVPGLAASDEVDRLLAGVKGIAKFGE